MIQPLFDKNQIFINMHKEENLIRGLVSENNYEQKFTDIRFSYLCTVLGVNYDEFMEEYNNFKKSVDI